MSPRTEDVMQNHLTAARIGVDAVMNDYTDESVLVTREQTYRGRAEIRYFFTELLNGSAAKFLDSFVLNRYEVAGELGYIYWESNPWFPKATDTFVVRNGKILFQTFTALAPE